MVMFCPNATDWGNVADWVSGIGSTMAVVTALGIAVHQSRSTNKLERARVKTEAFRRNSVIDEAIRLIEEAEQNAGQFKFKMEISHSVATTPAKRDYITAQKAIGTRLLQLQALEMTNPSIYTEIGRITAMLDVQQEPQTVGDSAFAAAAKSLIDRLVVRKDLLNELRQVLDENDAA